MAGVQWDQDDPLRFVVRECLKEAFDLAISNDFTAEKLADDTAEAEDARRFLDEGRFFVAATLGLPLPDAPRGPIPVHRNARRKLAGALDPAAKVTSEKKLEKKDRKDKLSKI